MGVEIKVGGTIEPGVPKQLRSESVVVDDGSQLDCRFAAVKSFINR